MRHIIHTALLAIRLVASASSAGSEGHLLRFQDPGHARAKTVIVSHDTDHDLNNEKN
jgi:hypothetical protein